VENGGAFYVKKWTFPQRRVHYVQYQYSLFYILLIWRGGVRAQRTPLHTGLLISFSDNDRRRSSGRRYHVTQSVRDHVTGRCDARSVAAQ